MATIGDYAKSCDACTASFSLYGAGQLVQFADWDKDTCFPFGLVVFAEVGYALLLVTSLVEAVARAILSIIGLVILLVTPYSCRDIRDLTFEVTFVGTIFNLGNALAMISALFDNLIQYGQVKKYDNFSLALSFDQCTVKCLRWLKDLLLVPPPPAPRSSVN